LIIGDYGVLCKLQPRAEVRYLQARRAFLVADEVVGNLVGENVHRPARGHPDSVLAEAARVLDGGE
jgi:hypothetical protein